jgi:AraC-like DNA-binding protein
MKNYYRYLSVSPEDERWGLNVLNAGCTHIRPSSAYPVETHPGHHFFRWNEGRVLDEYQVVYITRGAGVFESASCTRRNIGEGTIFLLFPGERHRYMPSPDTGWDEYWIGLRGRIMDDLIAQSIFTRQSPCLTIGFSETVFHIFQTIIEGTKQEAAGPMISGAAMHLIGCLYTQSRKKTKTHDEEVIDKARVLFQSRIDTDFSPEEAARELKVGYSWFRKTFKQQLGVSPGQYFLHAKIDRAKELLATPDVPVKEVAQALSFNSVYHFCKLFKEKTGQTPGAYRETAGGAERK